MDAPRETTNLVIRVRMNPLDDGNFEWVISNEGEESLQKSEIVAALDMAAHALLAHGREGLRRDDTMVIPY